MTYPRHLPNCVTPAKGGTLADGSVVEDDIGTARMNVDGRGPPTSFSPTQAPPRSSACTPWRARCSSLTRCGSGWRLLTNCGMASKTIYNLAGFQECWPMFQAIFDDGKNSQVPIGPNVRILNDPLGSI